MTTAPRLSVLDLVPVHTGQSSAEAIRASLSLVQLADRLGFERYWFAEHHNMPAVAASTPPVMIAAAASRTERIRVGSGGVMLPNHSPLVVAEQFAALEAIAPGRIDLGIGRAPGSDPVVTYLLRATGPTSDVEKFPEHVDQILALTSPDGASLLLGDGKNYHVRATPAAVDSPDVWLLGSSDYSARLAAEKGLPYAFASHFSGHGIDNALRLYRETFQPSAAFPRPTTFLTFNVSVSEDPAEAHARALPQMRAMARLVTGKPMGPQETVEAAQATPLDPAGEQAVESMRERWIIGTPAEAAGRLQALADRYDVDEIMLVPVSGARDADPMDETPGRAATLELLADALR